MEMIKPNVVNKLKKGNFTLNVLAYRSLNKTELMQAAAVYLRSSKRKSLPKNGEVTVISTIGLNGI